MNAATDQMLTDLGLDEVTKARLKVYDESKPPKDEDVWTNPTEVTLTLTAGQVMTLRAALHGTVHNALQSFQQAYALAMLAGVDFNEAATQMRQQMGDTEFDPANAFPAYLDVEDRLAEAWSDATGKTESVPDFIPAGWDDDGAV